MLNVPQYASVILVARDGSIIVQLRDDNPGISEPGQLMIFGGAIFPGEWPEDAARRELWEETTLLFGKLELFTVFDKDPARHGRPGRCFVHVARDVDLSHIDVREGQGYRQLRGKDDLAAPECSVLTRDILTKFFEQEAAR